MSKFKSKVCPYCKTAFKEGDDIVICGNCGMPHHRECWIENQGCTTFGCTGKINNSETADNVAEPVSDGFDYQQPQQQPQPQSQPQQPQPQSQPQPKQQPQPQPTPPSFVFCTKCGEKNSTAASFCVKCGNPIGKTVTPPPQPNYNQQYNQPPVQNGYGNNQQSNQPKQPFYSYGAVDKDVAFFVDTNLEYYIPKFNRMKMQNTKASWNWVAFFFAPYWFIYRKMYAYGFATIAAAFLLALVPISVISLLSLGGYIVLGIFANYIYMQWAEKAVSHAKGLPELHRIQHLKTQGGVNPTALTLAIVVYVAINIILGFAV